MKRYFRLLSRLLPLMVLSVVCRKQQTVTNPPQLTILQDIAQDPELTIFKAAMARCQLDTVFTSGGPFTIFCPVDSAFIAGGLTMDKISQYNPDSLSAFLKYHMITGKISINDIVGFLSENITTLDSGINAYLTKNYYGIFINGIPVIGTVEAGDGVVQKIGSLDPPSGQTVLQLINSLPELSYFAAAVAQMPTMQDLLDSLPAPAYAPWERNQQPGTYQGVPGLTVFAPTNAAFQASGSPFPTLASIAQASPNELSNIFNYYVLNGYQFTSGFIGGWAMGTQFNNVSELVPNNFEFAMAKDGVTLLIGYSDNGSGQTSVSQQLPKIIKPNILGTNGVIQEIDQVFINP